MNRLRIESLVVPGGGVLAMGFAEVAMVWGQWLDSHATANRVGRAVLFGSVALLHFLLNTSFAVLNAAPAVVGRGGQCWSDFANPAGSNGYLTGDGKLLYLLGAGGGSGVIFYRVDLVDFKAVAVLGVKQRINSVFVNHGDPIMGGSALAFPLIPGGCSEGAATGVNLSFEKSEGAATNLGKGNYGVTRSNKGLLLVDLDRRAILETDVQTFQSRVANKYNEGEIPLYFDLSARSLLSWNIKARGVALWRAGAKAPEQKVQLKASDRLIQDGSRVAVVATDRVTNSLNIRVLAKWSGVERDALYNLKLPAAYKVSDAAIEINLSKGLAAVSAMPGPERLRWQKVFVFDFKSEKPVATLLGTSSQYFEYFGLTREGDAVVAELRQLSDRASVEVQKYDFKRNAVQSIQLRTPDKMQASGAKGQSAKPNTTKPKTPATPK